MYEEIFENLFHNNRNRCNVRFKLLPQETDH